GSHGHRGLLAVVTGGKFVRCCKLIVRQLASLERPQRGFEKGQLGNPLSLNARQAVAPARLLRLGAAGDRVGRRHVRSPRRRDSNPLFGLLGLDATLRAFGGGVDVGCETTTERAGAVSRPSVSASRCCNEPRRTLPSRSR